MMKRGKSRLNPDKGGGHILFWPSFFLFTALSLLPALSMADDLRRNDISIVRTDASGGAAVMASFSAEIAYERAEKQRGLSGRDRIADSDSMLFILDDSADNYFWMKGMRFPLDVLAFNKAGILLKIIIDLKPCEECPLYLLPSSSKYVLEINGRLSEKLGLRSGDRLVLSSEIVRQRRQK